MSTSHPLRHLITEVSSPLKSEGLEPNEVFVVVDAQTYQVVPSARKLLTMFSRPNHRYYLIRTAEDVSGINVAGRKLEILSPCKFELEYKAWCPAKGSHRLATNVAANGAPGERVDAFVRGWTKEIIERGAEDQAGPVDIACYLTENLLRRAEENASFLKFDFNVILPDFPREFVVDNPPAEVAVRLDGYERAAVVKSRLRLTCTNPCRYLRSNVPELKSWVEQQVRMVINEFAWGTNYSAFLSGFSSIKEKIREQITKNGLESIGYEVRQLLTEPDTPEFVLLSRLSLDEAWECDTRQPGVNVKVHVVFNGKLSNLEASRIQAILRSEENIRERIEREIKKSIEMAMRSFLHTVYHDEFHQKFWPSEENPDSYEAELTRRAAQVLKEFNAVGPSGEVAERAVIVKMGKDHVIEQFEKLTGTPLILNPIDIIRHEGGEEARFHVELRLMGVNQGNIPAFLQRARSAELVKEGLQEEIRATLALFPKEAIWYANDNERRAVTVELQKRINAYACQQFGLRVEIASLRRDVNLIEGVNATGMRQRAKALEDANSEQIDVQRDELITQAKRRRELMLENPSTNISDADRQRAVADLAGPLTRKAPAKPKPNKQLPERSKSSVEEPRNEK